MPQFRYGLAVVALLAGSCSLFWFVGRHWEPQPVPVPALSAPLADDEGIAGTQRERNIELGWGFADRWFPLIQAAPPSTSPIVMRAPEDSADLDSTLSKNLAQGTPTENYDAIPLPRRRPLIAGKPPVPLPRSRPGDPAPQGMLVAVGGRAHALVEQIISSVTEGLR